MRSEFSVFALWSYEIYTLENSKYSSYLSNL